MGDTSRINLDVPRYDQSQFIGRLQHFFGITDWRLCFKSDKELDEVKDLLQRYRNGQEPPGTPEEKIWYAKRLFNPLLALLDVRASGSGSLHIGVVEVSPGIRNALSRLRGHRGRHLQAGLGEVGLPVPLFPNSAVAPAFAELIFKLFVLYTDYSNDHSRSTPAVVFWQWANQSFNALVNFTNRNAKSPLTEKQMGVAYLSATGAALATALGLKSFLAGRASTLLQRYVPFAAVAAANCINIPLMRQNELLDGIIVCDEDGNELVSSRLAAVKGISQVVFSRIFMAAPGMTLLPVIMEKLEKQAWLRKNPRLNAPFQVLACGVSLTFMTPAACALFNQKW
nr:sideroflexin-2-like [Procambarus clarkii]